uniref:Uncharacterized protein n=1 Tax=Oryzias latipes TaxID=8090 RepID=A0A3P9KW65_ORYLA
MCFLLRIPSKAYYFISFIVFLIFLWTFYRYSQDIIRNSASTMCFDDMELTMKKQTNVVEAKHRSNKVSWRIENLSIPNGLIYPQPSTQKGRTDVNCVTNWNVPLVWEGTFDPIVIDAIYKKTNPRVGVMIFAVGKYTGFLKGFLETGEKHFLTDFRVTYYIFTDNEKEVPAVSISSLTFSKTIEYKIILYYNEKGVRWGGLVSRKDPEFRDGSTRFQGKGFIKQKALQSRKTKLKLTVGINVETWQKTVREETLETYTRYISGPAQEAWQRQDLYTDRTDKTQVNMIRADWDQGSKTQEHDKTGNLSK